MLSDYLFEEENPLLVLGTTWWMSIVLTFLKISSLSIKEKLLVDFQKRRGDVYFFEVVNQDDLLGQ